MFRGARRRHHRLHRRLRQEARRDRSRRFPRPTACSSVAGNPTVSQGRVIRAAEAVGRARAHAAGDRQLDRAARWSPCPAWSPFRAIRRRSARARATSRSTSSSRPRGPMTSCRRWSTPCSTRRATIPASSIVDTDLKLNSPQLDIAVDRDKAAAIGVEVDTLGRTLETMLGGRQVTRFKRDGEQYDVVVKIADIDRQNPDDLRRIYVRGRDNAMIPLSNLITHQGDGGAEGAQPLQPAARRDDHRAARAGLYAERRPRLPRADRQGGAAERPRISTMPASRASSRKPARACTSPSCSRSPSSISCSPRSSRASPIRSSSC